MIIKNVTVIDGTGAVGLPAMDVRIAEGRFEDIRPSGVDTARPSSEGTHDGEVVLDGRGGYLLPGLWESHTHLTGLDMSLPEAERLPQVLSTLSGYLDSGITSVCDLGGPVTQGRTIREARQAGHTAASLFFAGPVLTGVQGWPLSFHGERSMAVEVGSADEARRQVEKLLDQVDFVKCILDGRPTGGERLPVAALEAVVQTAHGAGKKVLVHVATGTDLRDAVAAGADCIEHAFIPQDPTDTSEAEQIADLLGRTGTLYCPTLVTWEQLGRSGDPAHLDELVVDGISSAEDAAAIAARPTWGMPFPHHPADESLTRFDHAVRTLPLFHEAGVKLVAGSDITIGMPTPGSALLRELQLFAQAGLPLSEVVTTATGHAAERVGKRDSAGTVTVGAVADALLLDADPHTDISHLIDPRHHQAVISSGRLVRSIGI
ncbi:amidohydrolase family protein [Promicromonospora sp. NPDC050880]|uniref:amidohydrolase family protein n=1 Tax=Promicromonospora sp. NPDC050880 TaxID=3364406 RepID=UPI0037B5556B